MVRELTSQQELLRLTGDGVRAKRILELMEKNGIIRKTRTKPFEFREVPSKPFEIREEPVGPISFRPKYAVI